MDERMDELRAARLELSTQRTIIAVLQQESTKNEEQMSQIQEQCNEKVRQMEQMFKSYHERSEVNFI